MSTETPAPIDPDLLRKAQRRVALRMGFFSHALVHVAVNAGQFALNIFQGGPLLSLKPLRRCLRTRQGSTKWATDKRHKKQDILRRYEQ